MKRTRHIYKPYFLTVPRVAIEGKVYEIKLKVSQVIVKQVGKVSITKGTTDVIVGEIDE